MNFVDFVVGLGGFCVGFSWCGWVGLMRFCEFAG